MGVVKQFYDKKVFSYVFHNMRHAIGNSGDLHILPYIVYIDLNLLPKIEF